MPSDKTPAEAPSRASRRILVVGCGSIGERHIRCLLRTSRVTVGVCEPNHELRSRVADAYGITNQFASLDAALSQPWDGAVIATPAPSHVPIAVQLLKAGVAPLIEKPLSVSIDGVDELADLARTRGLPVCVAYVYRAHPAASNMRNAIRSGRFGAPRQLVAVAGQHFPTYRPAYRQTYYADHASGGGAVQDALTHVLNLAEWIAGPITSVIADMDHLVLDGVDVEDTVHILARHDSVLANYSLNQHQAPNECTVTVACERGTARFELHAHRWGWMERPDSPWTFEPAPIGDRDEWFTAQEAAWLDTLDGLAPPLCTLDDGTQTLRVNLAILKAAAAGTRVHLGYPTTSSKPDTTLASEGHTR